MTWQFPYYTAFSSGSKTDSEHAFLEMENRWDWIEALKHTEQDSEYHAEGNVWIHTKMVVNALMSDSSWTNHTAENQNILFASGLMHDVAKAWTTIEEAGRIRAPRHAKKGARFSRSFLYRLREAPSFRDREQIFHLIRYHGLPLWFWDKVDPRKFVFKAALHTDFNLLANLVKADILGRICSDQDELLGRLDYFLEFCEQHQCISGSFPFADQLTRFTYFRKEESEPTYQPFDDYRSEVILMVGIPGSGKNTWIEKQGPGWPIVSLDAIRRKHKISPKANQGKVAQMAREEAKTYLRKGENFIWNATNITKSLRSSLVDLFETYRAKTRIIYLETSYTNLLERNRSRTFPVPKNVLEKMIDKLEIPELDEAPLVEYQIDGTQQHIQTL